MLAGFAVGALTSLDNPIYTLRIEDFGLRLLVTAGITLAVWVPVMLLTRPDIQEVFARVRRMLAPGGRLFFSVPLSRDDVAADEFDTKGRRFTSLAHAEWTGICSHTGFDILASTITSDGLGRKTFAWLNCLAVTDRKK